MLLYKGEPHLWFPLFPSENHPLGRFGRIRANLQADSGFAVGNHNLFEKRLIKNFHSWFVRTMRAKLPIRGLCYPFSHFLFCERFWRGCRGTLLSKRSPLQFLQTLSISIIVDLRFWAVAMTRMGSGEVPSLTATEILPARMRRVVLKMVSCSAISEPVE